jgi:sugar lactone lactonase YvrE
VQRLVHEGNAIQAIKVFREAFGTGLKESKDAVEAIARGESVDITSMQVQRREREAERSRPRAVVHEFRVDPEAVKGAAKKVGAGMAATGLLFTFFIVAIVGVVAYFAVDFSGDEEPTGLVSGQKNKPPEAKAQKGSPAQEVLRFGGEGNGAGRFKDNRHVAVDGKGRIYSSDYSPFRIQVFDAEGKFINQWKPEEGTNLYDLKADRDGNLYIANDRGLFKFEGETGKLLAKAGKLSHPRGVALTWDNKVVAANGKELTIFDTSLKPLNEFKDAAERASSTFGFEMLAVDGDGVIYAKDRTGKDVCKFSPDGRFLDRFELAANSPNDIAIDTRGRLYVADTSRIYIVDPAGKPVLDFEARQAFGMAFDQTGALYVASRPHVVKYVIDE